MRQINNFCRQCGYQLESGARFCKKCGSPTSSTVDTSPQIILNPKEVIPPKNDAPDSTRTFKGMGRIFGIALIGISFIFDFIGIFGDMPFLVLGLAFFGVGLLLCLINRT